MKIAIFDFDGTLFTAQSIPFFMDYYLQANYPKGPYIKYLIKLMTCMTKYRLPMFKGYGKEQFRREVALHFIQIFNGQKQARLAQFFEEVGQRVVAVLNQEVVEEVKKCKREGYHCVLLSGCYVELLQHVGNALDIDTVIGTPIDETMVKDGCMAITTLDIGTGARKVEKLKRIFEGSSVDWQASTSYGDSSYDQPILELVGNPVAVRPDEILKEVAKQKGWRIIN